MIAATDLDPQLAQSDSRQEPDLSDLEINLGR
jgi:hypothetical protein